jgi:FKBP-type peptidyl-prolyl cis-trans isomerase
MRSLPILAAAAAVALATTAFADATPKTEDEKTIYALGLALSRNLATFQLTPDELKFVEQGLNDGVLNKKTAVTLEEYGPKIQDLQKSRIAKAAEGEKKKGVEFAAKAEKEKGAKKLESGVIVQQVKAGTGASPKPTDKVKVHYHGTLIDGSVFDSSVDRGDPATFPLNGVIPCWTQGLQEMKVGGKSKLVCPSDTAYGDRGSPPKIQPGSTLVFDVELLEIVAAPAPAAKPPAPAPGAKPPAPAAND